MSAWGFSPAVRAQTDFIDETRYDTIYVIGDVHGCRDTLDILLDELAPTDRDLVILVGDLVRRAPTPKA